MRKKNIKKNVLFAAILQVTNTICGFILPRLLIKSFGAEAYGLTTSIAQFTGYVTLLEGGVSGVVLAALYKPLANNNEERVSQIISTVGTFFFQIGLIIIIYTISLALCYPYFKSTPYSNSYIFAMVLVISFRLLVQYFLSMKYRLLLTADQKGYIVSVTHIFITWLNLGLAIIAIKLFNDIIWVKLFSGMIFLLQPVVFGLYVKKRYKLDKRAEKDKELIAQRWDGFGQNLAYFIHTNTDVVILTFFSSLASITVYSIYLMIANALKSIVAIVSSSLGPSIGNVLAKDNTQESCSAFELYEFTVELLTFFLYSCGFVLLIPFVRIYTFGMTDAEYIQPLFGVILLLAEMAYCIRDPYVTVAYAKGHFRQTKRYAFGEAIINILVSLCLVGRLGLIGVAAGTLISMSIRAVQQVYYLQKNILCRSMYLFIKRMIVFGIGCILTIFISWKLIPLNGTSYIQWIRDAVSVALIAAVIFGTLSFTIYRETVMRLVTKLVARRK